MQLSFKQKIVLAMLAASIVPMVMTASVAITMSYRNAVKLAGDGITSAHDGIQNQVEDYLNVVRLQVQEQALSPLVKSAIKEFSAAEKTFDVAKEPADMQALKQRYATQQQKTPGSKAGDDAGWMVEGSVAQALQSLYIAKNPNPLGEKQKLTDAGDGSDWSKAHAKYHPVFRNIIDEYGYYDYFLIDAETGTVVYTNFKEIDFQSNVKTGPLAQSGFSRTVKQALASSDPRAVFFSDVEPYLPSYNDDAIFIAAPVIEDGKTIGAIAFQIPTGKLNGFFHSLKQLGTTVDGYVIGSDSKLKTPMITEDAKVGDTAPESLAQAAKDALAGKDDGIVDYLGADGGPMVGKLDKVNVQGLDWVLAVGIDHAEMMQSNTQMIYITLGLVAAILVVMVLLGVMLSTVLVKPILGLAESFSASAKKVSASTGEVTEAVAGMVAATEETATQSKVIRKNSNEASGYVKSVAQAVGELNISINDISQSIGEANSLIDDAVEKAKRTDDVVRKLGEAAGKISEVVNLINGLAEQTNLLALNAAIEAARAGDAGRGFAVVADEVKKLASHTSNATVEISDQIQSIQSVTDESVKALQVVVEAIHKIRDSATTVSAAVEEQSGVAKQIAASVDDAAQRVQEVDTNMSGIEQATNDTSVAADQVSGASGAVKSAFAGLQSDISKVLQSMGVVVDGK